MQRNNLITMHTHSQAKNRIKPSLSTHLWILSNVLIEPDHHKCPGRKQFPSVLVKHLSRYIAAVSYKRMARRFNNTNLSMPYFESLKQVKTIRFMSRGKRANNNRRDRVEVESDRLFIEDFVKLYTSNPGLLKTPIPNLINMANHLPPTGSDDFELYTNETCNEFHHLLLELLDCFKYALDSLVTLDKDKGAKGSDLAVKQFNQLIGDVHRNGYALLRISRGRAFQMYLENIKTFLKDPRGSNVGASIGEHKEEIDEELEAIQSFLPQRGSDGAEKALLKSYTAWLRLMVGHFDAAEILVRHVTSNKFPYGSISIKILVAPPTDSALLPWSQLFTDYKYLPKSGSLSVISNDEIHEFLVDGISKALKTKDAIGHAQNALKCSKQPELDYHKLRHSLISLTKSTDGIVKEKATNLLSQFPKTRTDNKSRVNHLSTANLNEIQALCDVLGELSDEDRFFLALNNLSFTGTLHCEACLSSLLPLFTRVIPSDDSKYKEIKILPNMQVEYLLSHLFLSSDPHVFIF